MSDLIEYKGYKIKITTEEDPMNPRGDDYDCNLGHLICWHSRYRIGDDHKYKQPENLLCDVSEHTVDRYEDAAINGYRLHKTSQEFMDEFKSLGNVVCLPIYLYDHSGQTIKTTPFDCPWDSGWVGLIYVTKAELRKRYGWKNITKQRIAQVEEWLRDEVATYDDYMTGSVYRYQIIAPDGEEGESYGEYYGYDHEKSGLLPEARSSIDSTILHKLKTEGEQTELPLECVPSK
jgi:hypothetical protein